MVICSYNQAKTGMVCFDANKSECSSECSYCNNLSASVVFDTEKLMMVQNVAIFVQNAPSAPRSWSISYSFEGPTGPWKKFTEYEMAELKEGEVSLTEVDGGVVAARYWKVEITSNWGASEVELKEVRLFGIADASVHRRLEETATPSTVAKEVTVDGSSMDVSDYVLKYTFMNEAPLFMEGYRLSVVRIYSIQVDGAISSGSNVLVVGQTKTFSVNIGNHDDTSNDRVKFVVGTDCSAPAFGEEYTLTNNTFTVHFQQSVDVFAHRKASVKENVSAASREIQLLSVNWNVL